MKSPALSLPRNRFHENEPAVGLTLWSEGTLMKPAWDSQQIPTGGQGGAQGSAVSSGTGRGEGWGLAQTRGRG